MIEIAILEVTSFLSKLTNCHGFTTSCSFQLYFSNVINVSISSVTIAIHGFNREGGVQHSALSPIIADREGGVNLSRCIMQRAFNKCATFQLH